MNLRQLSKRMPTSCRTGAGFLVVRVRPSSWNYLEHPTSLISEGLRDLEFHLSWLMTPMVRESTLPQSSIPLVGGNECGSKTSGRKNGGLAENGAIDELEREAAAADTVMAMVRMAGGNHNGGHNMRTGEWRGNKGDRESGRRSFGGWQGVWQSGGFNRGRVDPGGNNSSPVRAAMVRLVAATDTATREHSGVSGPGDAAHLKRGARIATAETLRIGKMKPGSVFSLPERGAHTTIVPFASQNRNPTAELNCIWPSASGAWVYRGRHRP